MASGTAPPAAPTENEPLLADNADNAGASNGGSVQVVVHGSNNTTSNSGSTASSGSGGTQNTNTRPPNAQNAPDLRRQSSMERLRAALRSREQRRMSDMQ